MKKGGFISLLWSLLAKPLSELLMLFGECLLLCDIQMAIPLSESLYALTEKIYILV